jgi:hypothetical protein
VGATDGRGNVGEAKVGFLVGMDWEGERVGKETDGEREGADTNGERVGVAVAVGVEVKVLGATLGVLVEGDLEGEEDTGALLGMNVGAWILAVERTSYDPNSISPGLMASRVASSTVQSE